MSSHNTPSPPLWMLPNFFRSPLRVLPALTAGSKPRLNAYIPFALSRSRKDLKMTAAAVAITATNVVLPTSTSTSDASSTSSADSSSLEDNVAQKIATQEAKVSTGRRIPLRERVSNKLYVSTPSSGTKSRFNVQSLRAALTAPILAALGTATTFPKPTTPTVTVPASALYTDPTLTCSLGQNVFLARAMSNQIPPTLVWSDASWGNWATVEARYIVHILPGEQAVRAYGERSYRGKLPFTKRHYVPAQSGSEGEEGTHILRLVPQPQNHGGESALSVKQIAEALAFVWETWDEAEELQRIQSGSAEVNKTQVELPPILFVAPAGSLTTDASLAALALAYKKTLSGGAGRRECAHVLWDEMLDDEEGVKGEWHDALGFLNWEDVDFVENMWPRAEVDEKDGDEKK